MQFSLHGSGHAISVSARTEVAVTLYLVFLLPGWTSLSFMNKVSP